MKRVLATLIPLMLLSTSSFADNTLAMVDNGNIAAGLQTKSTESVKVTSSSALQNYLIKARRNKNQDDFVELMKSNYPSNYKMMTSLPSSEQDAIYAAFKQGERVRALRTDVIARYTAQQQK
ncbi:MAG: hypothetical protein ACWA5Q_07940 [bacterium]